MMTNLEKMESAKTAVLYLLRRIQSDPRLAYYFHLTAAHDHLLTACAHLTDQDRDQVAEAWEITETENPVAAAKAELQEEMAEEPFFDCDDVLPTEVWALKRDGRLIGITLYQDVARSYCLQLSAEMEPLTVF